MNKTWGCVKVQVGWKNAFYGETGSRKGHKKVSARPWPLKEHFLTFTLSVNKIIIYQFSMFKSLDSIALVVWIFMYLTISKFKQVLRSRKGLDYNTGWQQTSVSRELHGQHTWAEICIDQLKLEVRYFVLADEFCCTEQASDLDNCWVFLHWAGCLAISQLLKGIMVNNCCLIIPDLLTISDGDNFLAFFYCCQLSPQWRILFVEGATEHAQIITNLYIIN